MSLFTIARDLFGTKLDSAGYTGTPLNDYSPWVQAPNETLLDYYKRLQASREGGILGTAGLMDVPRSRKIDASKGEGEVELGKEVYGDSNYTYDPYIGSDWESGGYSRKDQEIGDALDRLTGRAYAGQGLLYNIPNFVSNLIDKSTLKSQLMDAGWTKEQAEEALKDPELLKATQSLDRLGVLSKDAYDYKKQGTQDSLFDVGSSVVGKLFGLDKEQSRQSPFRTPDQFDAPMPLLDNARTSQILAAQARMPFDPFGSLTKGLFDQQKWVEVSAKNVAAEKARKEAAARQAENRRANDMAYGGGSSVYGSGEGSSASSASRSSSALGSGSTVGSQGGNASRGYSYGGW